ncbi:efflux RND transporter periplasmic adaptor subunit [Cystobacter fuscus]
MGHTSLRAPFDGVVASILVRQGEAVDGNGQPVLEVAALHPLEVRAPAAPNVAVRLRQAMRVRVRLPAAGLEREGHIVSVAPTADATTGNFLVRVVLDNKEGDLKLGLLAEVAVPLRTWDTALAVASPALVPGTDGGLAVVEVVEGKARTAPVRVAFEGEDHAVLESGVDAGAAIVIEGGYSLPDGTEVEVVP